MAEFIVDLFPQGDEGSAFRQRNAPGEKSRNNIIDGGSTLMLKGTLIEVLHGTMTPKNESTQPATLLVLEFRFVSTESGRRFRGANITLRFGDAHGDAKLDPEVYRITHDGHFSMNETNVAQQLTYSANAGLQGGIPMVGASAGISWSLSESRNIDHTASLVGHRRVLGRLWGADNSAVWVLGENPDKKDGIPTLLRTAVLLRRKAEVPFTTTVEVRTKVDFVSEVKSLFGSLKEPVDPIELDPGSDTGTGTGTGARQRRAERDFNMNDVDLVQHCAVIFSTLLG